jgi:predicted dehydrogenase
MKRKKILVLGCGSIGSRHAKNLRLLGVKDIILCDKSRARLDSLGKEIKTDLLYEDFRKAVKENNDILAAIICTPTALHMDPSVFFAKNKINLFIEKPLSHNLQRTTELFKISKMNKIKIMMGHSYLFEKGYLTLKQLIKTNTIGKIYYATYLQGQYLPDWHPYADYKVEYSARKELGGGVLLTLTSHSFYVIEWLFGKIKSIHGNIVDKVGSLDINVDDSVLLLLTTEKNIIVQSQNNFITRIHQHKLIVEGSKGKLEYDFVRKTITILLLNKKPKIVNVDNGPNDRFVREMKYFLDILDHGQLESSLNLKSGIRFLKFAKNLKI